ncbi:hypothetical protein FVEN_g714 [Fusarium venenatum]|uniref:PNPLA domain-containing protein n=1 Tax=Fusarium venenatum TaxID=56646 RepID=A0A2L2TZU4_9HYPO|nr:uncharacterized protein FVRRES_10883 [Fusarium venenatum]KAG8361454.1 hypothetical protein FVEN_g714 [Fusarium venenatum]KAH6967457.1 acyl transferase/acyl hydrolase/lysophospholipase [Fusarium venenatum]CEI70806.1 unnamed protein product [Fusarium venenatum]
MEDPETKQAREFLEAAAKMQVYPKTSATANDGKYAIGADKGGRVASNSAEIRYFNWLRTPALDARTIQRLHSLQLVADSHDQGWYDDRDLGNWTWFEVAIFENDSATDPRKKDDIILSWTSHRSKMAPEFQRGAKFSPQLGSFFSRDHDIFRLLEEGNVIVVRLCSRFPCWSLKTNQGFLVVELGPEVERESVEFGSIAAKVKTTQEAFNDINRAIFPELESLPTVPRSVFKAEMMSTDIATDKPLRVLCLDGGGVRGLASLKILKRVMEMSYPGKKPCEVFDMIAGTSTGGFIAIMLGRLEMDVDECIESYTKFMGKVFPDQGGVLKKLPFGLGKLEDWWETAVDMKNNVFNNEKWDSGVLEEVIKDLVHNKLDQDPKTVLLQDEKTPEPSCKIFVTATASAGSNSRAPVLLRSYTNGLQMPEMPRIKLWEAARATSAAPFYFKPLEVDGRTFVDGGLQANNPLGWLWNEILQVYGPVRSTGCFLSIGTGVPLSVTLPAPGSHPLDFITALSGVATNSDVMNILFRSLINAFAPKGMQKKYWRFNFGDGLPDWVEEDGVGKWRLLATREENDLGGLDDVNMIKLTKTRVENYMKEPGFELMVQECAAALKA